MHHIVCYVSDVLSIF